MYSLVHRMVMWGEPEEDVFYKLKVNGVTSEDAERLYQQARRERVASIRSDSVRKAVKGGLCLGASVVVFCAFWFGMGFIVRPILCACAVALGLGLWWSVGGVVEFLTAASRKGSLADD